MAIEVFPLAWPAGWPRTRPQDRKTMGAWSRTANQYREALGKEIQRTGADSFVISSNVQVSQRGSMVPGIEPADTGVAIYFTKPVVEDWTWQDALGLKDPYPTEEQVKAAFRRLADQFHPDKPGGDLAMFQQAVKHRDNALRWINRKTNQKFDYSLASDSFKEVRLNMAALMMTLKAIRQIERCGTSTLLERAYKGFEAIAESASA